MALGTRDVYLPAVCDTDYIFIKQSLNYKLKLILSESIFNLNGSRKQLADKLDVLSQSIVRALNAEVTSISWERRRLPASASNAELLKALPRHGIRCTYALVCLHARKQIGYHFVPV